MIIDKWRKVKTRTHGADTACNTFNQCSHTLQHFAQHLQAFPHKQDIEKLAKPKTGKYVEARTATVYSF